MGFVPGQTLPMAKSGWKPALSIHFCSSHCTLDLSGAWEGGGGPSLSQLLAFPSHLPRGTQGTAEEHRQGLCALS